MVFSTLLGTWPASCSSGNWLNGLTLSFTPLDFTLRPPRLYDGSHGSYTGLLKAWHSPDAGASPMRPAMVPSRRYHGSITSAGSCCTRCVFSLSAMERNRDSLVHSRAYLFHIMHGAPLTMRTTKASSQLNEMRTTFRILARIIVFQLRPSLTPPTTTKSSKKRRYIHS